MLASRLAALDCAEVLDVGVLAAERLHLAHAGDALLQVGVDVADLDAGAAERLARLAGEPARRDDHQRDHRQADQRVGHAELQHLDSRSRRSAAAPLSTLHQRKADRLLDGVHVVGDAAHHVAGLVLGVVAQRQLVQVLEHVDAQVLAARAGRSSSSRRTAGRSSTEPSDVEHDQHEHHAGRARRRSRCGVALTGIAPVPSGEVANQQLRVRGAGRARRGRAASGRVLRHARRETASAVVAGVR